MKTIGNLLIGSLLSLMIITLTIFHFNSFSDIVPYIGGAILGGILMTCIVDLREKIESLQKEIEQLKNKDNV